MTNFKEIDLISPKLIWFFTVWIWTSVLKTTSKEMISTFHAVNNSVISNTFSIIWTKSTMMMILSTFKFHVSCANSCDIIAVLAFRTIQYSTTIPTLINLFCTIFDESCEFLATRKKVGGKIFAIFSSSVGKIFYNFLFFNQINNFLSRQRCTCWILSSNKSFRNNNIFTPSTCSFEDCSSFN
jgi:hypothetical protein